jgi:hypothetical protein
VLRLDIPQDLAEAGDLRLLTGLFDDADVEPELATLRATVMLTFECYEEEDTRSSRCARLRIPAARTIASPTCSTTSP